LAARRFLSATTRQVGQQCRCAVRLAVGRCPQPGQGGLAATLGDTWASRSTGSASSGAEREAASLRRA